MSFLDNVKLAYSCPLAWDKLVGGESRRHCGDCDKHVTNLSAMTRGQAQTWLVEQQSAPICIRVEVDQKGRSVHRPTLRNAALAALAVGAAACSTDDDSDWDTADFVDTGVAIAEASGGSAPRGAGARDSGGTIAEAGVVSGGNLVADRGNARLELTRGEQERAAAAAAEAAGRVHDVRGEPTAYQGQPMMGVMPAPPRPLMGKPSRPPG